MSGLLDGKLALVTGAGRGIGFATALAFARNGARVLLNGRSVERAAEAAKLICETVPGADVRPLVFDVTDSGAVKLAFSEVHKEYQGLDILVNNAGVLKDALVGMASEQMFQEVMGVNLSGTFKCAQFAARLMARAGSGSIINISSIVGRYGNAGQSVYAASKAGVIGLTLSLAKELAPANVRVYAIAPGFIETDMIASVPEEKRRAILDGIKMGKMGTAEDVANAAIFLGSELSSYVTGQVLGVDGGMTI